ncbi:MAG TPA: DNA primase [Actinomycetota bacterium]|nr:DNA primase [Actinomycetota bacterium]
MPGRFLEQDLAEVRERANLVEVISAHTQLRKAGPRTFKGLCPFHQEKTPSFTVDPAKQVYYCFGCGAGGDVFDFLRGAEGLSFAEAAERLATRLGITLRTEAGAAPAAGSGRRRLLDATRTAADYFTDLLNASPEAAVARRYVQARGFSKDDARAWRLGYAPSGRDTLYRHLLGRKFTPDQIVEAGLALVTDSGEHRDRFRGRLVFPTADLSGDVVGFGARALGDEPPKYLNSPETALYHKSKLLYGLDRAKKEMVRAGQAVVCEGYTDVMGLHKVGVGSAVATCGTALGEDHFATIKRFCDRVILAFDADAAGSFASERGFGIDAKVGVEVLVALLPPGKDPADLALAPEPDGGAAAVEEVIKGAVPVRWFMIEAVLRRHRLDTPESKGKALRDLAPVLSSEPSRVVRGEYAFRIARLLGVDERTVQQEISELGRAAPASTARRKESLPGHVRLEREALALLLDSPRRLDQVEDWLTEDHFTRPEHRLLLRGLLACSRTGSTASILEQLPDEDTRRLGAELALTSGTNESVEEVFMRLEEFRLQRQIQSLRATLGRLEPGADPAGSDSLFQELMRLESQRRRFDDR